MNRLKTSTQNLPKTMNEKAKTQNGMVVDKIISIAKEATGIFAILATFTYVFGFFITNVYLGKVYGIFDFSLIKSRYVYTGAIFLVYCLFAFFSAFLVRDILSIETRKSKPFTVLKIIFALFIWLVSPVFYTHIAIDLANKSGKELYLEPELIVWVIAWFIVTILIFTMYLWFIRKDTIKDTGYSLAWSVSIIIGVVSITTIYAIQIHKLMPVSIGGGRPIPVKLVVASDDLDLVNQIIPIENQNITQTVYLLEENSSSYFLLVNNNNLIAHTVEVKKSLIVSVIHQYSIPFEDIGDFIHP